ncbi:LysE family translocator [Vibrio sp. ZSDE26]|uniref:LysE family translocator n=1 Tax=Vibrio amylolyticus TaxID=2847292 RepID=A0A9X2BKJ9_9VIBR|nr:LysE family translocator [Vibrio amylolyticus]MCK6262913.1 LysE family translocator [Vibrio amylolyticus]
MTLESLWLFVGIVFFVAVVPGPNALLVLSTSLSTRKRHAAANIFGVSIGFLVHAFVSATGMSLLLAQSEMAFSMLKWVGACYLFWLGFSNIRHGYLTLDGSIAIPTPKEGMFWQHFRRGLLTNLLNPKIVLFYLSIFPQFVGTKTVISDSLMLGMVQATVVASWFCVVIVLAQRLKHLLTQRKTARILNYSVGGIFMVFAAQLALYQL